MQGWIRCTTIGHVPRSPKHPLCEFVRQATANQQKYRHISCLFFTSDYLVVRHQLHSAATAFTPRTERMPAQIRIGGSRYKRCHHSCCPGSLLVQHLVQVHQLIRQPSSTPPASARPASRRASTRRPRSASARPRDCACSGPADRRAVANDFALPPLRTAGPAAAWP